MLWLIIVGIPRSASDLFFFLSYSFMFLFVCRICKGIKERKKEDKGEGLRLFCGEECFPEPVEIIVLSHTRRLKNIMESSQLATSRIHNALLSSELNKQVRNPTRSREKKRRYVRLSDKGF